MAFNLENRFPPPPTYFTLHDPGAYNSHIKAPLTPKYSKVPFLSKTPRNTQSGVKIWTHSLYYADYPPKIPNCTSIISKSPRFACEISSKDNLEYLDELLCRCGIEKPCECSTEKEQVVCQAKIQKRLFKSQPPRSILGEGLSSPSKTDHGFNILADGSIRRIKEKITVEKPPFYNTNIMESTSFYRGCKWSKWTSSRSTKTLNINPGPAHYSLTSEPIRNEICTEKLRSYRRQTSKQLRFIEIVQQRDLLENRPGPASYSPLLPRGYEIKCLSQKSNRFPKKQQYDLKPGPADHWLQRDFDPIAFSGYLCHAKLPKPSFFGVKALRFQPQKEEGPSPTSYCPNYTLCNHLKCSTAPFGTTAIRFKSTQVEESDEEEKVESKNIKNYNSKHMGHCQLPTWEFRSKTVRMHKLVKKLDEPSPADLAQKRARIKRSRGLQYMAPFFSSEGRFQPWYNWIPVYGKLNTPGPCSYSLEKSKRHPAVYHGPIFRAKRFPPCKYNCPAPNEYNVGSNNIESILKTHNKRLKKNVDNQNKFMWEPPVEKSKLSYEEQENVLLNRSIDLLDTNDNEAKIRNPCTNKSNDFVDDRKPVKLLRCFLYNKEITSF